MMFRLASLLLVVSAFAVTGVRANEDDCETITELICTTRGFSTLCDAIELAGYDDNLDGTRPFTVFAPTNDAFKNLLKLLDKDGLEDIPLDTLKEVLSIHSVRDKIIEADDLECGKNLDMFKGTTRTVCSGSRVFQVGPGNSKDAPPRITRADNEACNGIVHVVNEVILPKLDIEEPCDTITDILCGDSDFDVFCKGLKAYGLAKGEETVFAPTDRAFDRFSGFKDLSNSELENLFHYHVAKGRKYDDDLRCDRSLRMANGQKTWTECNRNRNKFQYGWDNYKRGARKPKITEELKACDGVIHVLNDVMLPKGYF